MESTVFIESGGGTGPAKPQQPVRSTDRTDGANSCSITPACCRGRWGRSFHYCCLSKPLLIPVRRGFLRALP